MIQAKANVNAANDDGFTPLYISAQEGHADVVKQLLAVPGVTVDHQTKKDATALYIACENEHDEVVELLLAAKANPNLRAFDGSTALFIAAQVNFLISTLVVMLLNALDHYSADASI